MADGDWDPAPKQREPSRLAGVLAGGVLGLVLGSVVRCAVQLASYAHSQGPDVSGSSSHQRPGDTWAAGLPWLGLVIGSALWFVVATVLRWRRRDAGEPWTVAWHWVDRVSVMVVIGVVVCLAALFGPEILGRMIENGMMSFAR